MGCLVRNHLVKQVVEFNKLDDSLAENAANNGGLESLQKLGLDSALRSATARGISLFTDTQALCDELFQENPEATNV